MELGQTGETCHDSRISFCVACILNRRIITLCQSLKRHIVGFLGPFLQLAHARKDAFTCFQTSCIASVGFVPGKLIRLVTGFASGEELSEQLMTLVCQLAHVSMPRAICALADTIGVELSPSPTRPHSRLTPLVRCAGARLNQADQEPFLRMP